MSDTRRDFIKKTAATTGLIWAAPAIATVSRAHAQQGSTIECGCTGRGTGLQSAGVLTIDPLGTSDGAESCVATVAEPFGPGVFASAVCGSFDETTCTARSHVATFDSPGLEVSARGVESFATQGCDCSSAGDSTIAFLSVGGDEVDIPAGACNFAIPLPGVGSIVINEQVCQPDGSFTVSAIHILIDDPLSNLTLTNMYIAQSHVAASGCTASDCVECA